MDVASDPGLRSVAAPSAAAVAPDAEVSVLAEPEGWTDPLTGADGPRTWKRVLANEDARWRRYGRAITVAVFELHGFERDGSWLSKDQDIRFFARVARSLARRVRSSDHIARIGRARFGVILVETDEVSAINFVHNLRKFAATDLSSNEAYSIRTGWASPTKPGGLTDALALAEARLHLEAFQIDG